MAELASGLKVIVVGSSADGFVRDVLNLSNGCGVDTIFCEDVYSCVSKLGRSAGGLVVGRLDELSREDGRLFDVARMYGYKCCCFVDRNIAGRQKELLKAMERGALLAAEVEQIGEMLMKLSDKNNTPESTARTDGPATGATSSFFKDEFLITKAEMNALLGA
ncbi:MAG: hypothetical protein JXN61_18800 [Sedimentisphaerales bacterium]|nr:hypothetical protein [Sedimentisphaerales bacterium]